MIKFDLKKIMNSEENKQEPDIFHINPIRIYEIN